MPTTIAPPAAARLARLIWSLMFAGLLGTLAGLASGAETPERPAAHFENRPERIEWFRDLGLGLHIRWGLESQLGSAGSQSMVGASDDYLRRYIEELPRTFNPGDFRPDEWAVLAKLAGVRYVVFAAKDRSGFCMFETETTGFNIMNTPFRRDVTEEVLMNFRAQGIAPGLSFSADDYWWLHTNGKTWPRHAPEANAQRDSDLMEHDQAQLRELLSNYGPIDILSLDGEPDALRALAWEIDPYTVVTRGAIQPADRPASGEPQEGVWEAAVAMGAQRQYLPTGRHDTSSGELIAALIETRAQGGNLLLNVDPKPSGELPIAQEDQLREIAQWMFINQECIHDVRPWIITNEENVWFTKARDADTVFAIVKQDPRWAHGTWRDIVLGSVRATADTRISVLGQNDAVPDDQSELVPPTTLDQQSDGLHIRAMRTQRIHRDHDWPHPVVLKLTHVEPAMVPPQIDTAAVYWDDAAGEAVCEGEIRSLGDADELEAGFEYREITGSDAMNPAATDWKMTGFQAVTTPGVFANRVAALKSGGRYEVRAVVRHPRLTLRGRELSLSVP